MNDAAALDMHALAVGAPAPRLSKGPHERAAELLREWADELRTSCTMDDAEQDWTGEEDAKQLHDELLEVAAEISAAPSSAPAEPDLYVGVMMLRDRGEAHHGLDNDRQVLFYEQDFYVLSNFSSFSLEWDGITFATSEHAYHWEKFADETAFSAGNEIANLITHAASAHEAFKIAERYRNQRRRDWDVVKVDIMRRILTAKADQHEYVRCKLLATGDRVLIENSWRDDFWGWGPNRDGKNMLGKLWMEVRAELRAAGVGEGPSS